jgi:ribosomal protein S15P/S13E
MIVARPKDMTQEEYRLILKEQKRRIKDYLKGRPVQSKSLGKS